MLDNTALLLVFIGLGTWVTLVLIGAIAVFITLLTEKDFQLGDKSKRHIGATLVFGLVLIIIGYIMHGVDIFLTAYTSNFL